MGSEQRSKYFLVLRADSRLNKPAVGTVGSDGETKA
jgi:hypothetical protein